MAMDINEKVIQKFNRHLKSNLNNLEGIYDFQEQLKKEKDEIEKSLSMASTTTPSKVKAVIENVEHVSCEIKQMQETYLDLSEMIADTFSKNDKNLELQEVFDKIEQLDKSLSYLYFIRHVNNISDEIETSLLSNDDQFTITLYMNLTNISCQLQTSTCRHLTSYIHETLHFWHNLIKEKLSKEFSDLLKQLKWPFYGTNTTSVNASTTETLTRFKILIKYLFHLQLPEEMIKPVVTSVLLTDFAPVSLPVVFLIRPFRQRFIYHFTGAKLTNRQDKPEWFFTQILTWIKDHAQWVEKNVQPVADSIGLEHLDMKAEFMRALVQLAVEKLHSELPVVQYDDTLFAHLVDEALGFERELRETLLYPQTQPATIFILTQAHIFVKWINMEKKYATEKMDAILSSNMAWERLTGSDVDDMKITECADAFLTLLTTISDRYKHLPQPGHRWFAMQSSKEVASLSVTPSGCPMFQELATRLHTLHNILALPLFNQAWKNLAAQLDQFLFEEVVLVNHFNNGGAEQLQYDILRNLFPLFGLYINKPDSYFPLIKEACVLLNILTGSAILLEEALNNNDKNESTQILADIGVYKMSAKLALKVIETRTDTIHT
ncbi:RAD50-interacting protein 1 isoform X2 [Cardiocondyla obscurior]|uniref:RAD50-interacting protein 1 isoform X2 n=1 Tax=Cardiocondyla obscurior TaxID=286306 RepID=UPI0039656473